MKYLNKLSEKEKEYFYKVWSLGNRMWQDPIWASDVTSYAWGPDGTKLYVATSGIYGNGALYELDLIRKKYKQIAPTGCIAKLNNPSPGYVIHGWAKKRICCFTYTKVMNPLRARKSYSINFKSLIFNSASSTPRTFAIIGPVAFTLILFSSRFTTCALRF